MVNEILRINLRNILLEVWEREVSKRVVDFMRDGIKAGCEFPPVGVFRIGDEYRLVDTILYSGSKGRFGGHHRAVAHLEEDVPLPIEVVQGRCSSGVYIRNYFPVSDVVVNENLVYDDKVRDCLRHLES